jgi:transposase
VIRTIPGAGPATGAIILGEIGDINRFPTPKNLVAFAGIDPTAYQSGNFTGTNNRLSKKGSPYLRRAVWMSAVVASRTDPVFKAFYEKKRREGKAHGTAIGAVARKLLYTIYAVLKANKPYEVRLDTIE